MAICALLSPLGDAAPEAWVWLTRTVSLGSLVLAWTLPRRLSPLGEGSDPSKGTRAAAAAAVAGVAFAQGWLGLAAAGDGEPLLIAGVLVAAHAWLDRRYALLAAAAVACALIRVEAWPFLAAGVIALPRLRPALAPAAALVPALWLLPELAGSGELWRSAERARVPNPGQPALAAIPAFESLQRAVGAALWPLPAALALVRPVTREARLALVLGAAGLAWIAIVALMAQAGFSGEERYALPGVAVASVGAAAGLGRLAAHGPRLRGAAAHGPRLRAVALAALAAAAVLAGLRLGDFAAVAERQAHQGRLAAGLPAAIEAAGGRDAVLACGTPYTGDLRGPMTAWALRVEKRAVAFDPTGPGVVFSSRLHRDDPLEPAPAAGAVRSGGWVVSRRCVRAP